MMRETNLKTKNATSASLPDMRILPTQDVARFPQPKSPNMPRGARSQLNPNAHPKANHHPNINGIGVENIKVDLQNLQVREKGMNFPKDNAQADESGKMTNPIQNKTQNQPASKVIPKNGVMTRANSVPNMVPRKTGVSLSMAPKKPSLGASIPILKHSPACVCLKAHIESFDQRRSSTGEVAVMYRIVVGKGENTRMWQVYRRYTEFEALHKSLEQAIPERVYSQLKLPAKRGLRKYIEKDSTQNKAAALNQYLDTLLRYPITRDHIMTLRFLEAYEKQEEEDFIEQAVNLGKSLPTYHMSKLYTEYLHPRPLARPTSCKGMDEKNYGDTLAAAVAAATNPRIRNLRLEARVDLLDKKVNEPTKDNAVSGRKPAGRT